MDASLAVPCKMAQFSGSRRPLESGWPFLRLFFGQTKKGLARLHVYSYEEREAKACETLIRPVAKLKKDHRDDTITKKGYINHPPYPGKPP